MSAGDPGTELRLHAIEIKQSSNRTLYTFAVDGKAVQAFATVSRIRRSGIDLQGYQRPEVLSHIAEIRRYLESSDPMIPNSVVIAFDSRVRFEASGPATAQVIRPGTFIIPLQADLPDQEKPGFIVDGQQRLAAVRDARIHSFPICVNAFITDEVRVQTEQFILVNSTKPLPKSLIYELLPGTDTTLPSLLQRRRLPSYLIQRLNLDAQSPLRSAIQTPTNPGGIVKDNSLLRMTENSLSDGVLYRFRNPGSVPDTESMLAVLKSFWSAVKAVFAPAWGLPPRRSRLMHGAGVVTLGFLMDAIADRYRAFTAPSEEQFANDLGPLGAVCRWTDGYWDFGPGRQRKWNEIQNTSRDIQLLANYLLLQYKALVWRA